MTHYPWTSLAAPQLQQAIEQPTACLLLIDPQQDNADALARQLIAASLCENRSQGKACGQCHPCRLRQANTHPDIIIAHDTLNIEAVRELIAKLSNTPSIGKHRFIYLKNIDKYFESALNSLLKTLEEPSPHNHFILSAPSRRAVKATILSRSQSYQVPQADPAQARDWLITQGIDSAEAEQLLALYRNNPFLAYAQREQANPLALFTDFIHYCAQPKQQRQFLQILDNYPPEEQLDLLSYQCERLIAWIQLDSTPQNWQNSAQHIEQLAQIDIHRIHHLYAALCKLRRSKRQPLNWSLQSKTLLLHHMETRNPIL